MRIAVVDKERCKSEKCDHVCIRFCPMVRTRKEAIRLGEDDKAYVAEMICSGCGICVRKCPFDALRIVNLPDELDTDRMHRFGPNMFALYRLPLLKKGTVVGLIGRNGIGKSTIIKMLSGELVPNLGEYNAPPTKEMVKESFAGQQMYDYFDALYAGKLQVVHKPQYVDRIPKIVKGTVGEVLGRLDQRGRLEEVARDLEISHLMERPLDVLSGGELQRVAIATAVIRDADVYLFDEPSSHLDVYQRTKAARVIRSLVNDERIVVTAEHDLAVLDYMSDDIFLLYGEPDVYGIVSHIHSVREGINIYINGYIPDENIRFRDTPIIFHDKPPNIQRNKGQILLQWTEMKKQFEGFHLTVEAGSIGMGDVVGILGMNGIGKTTFIKMLAGVETPDEGKVNNPNLKVSYKPQYISGRVDGTVEDVLKRAAGDKYGEQWFKTEVLEPLHVKRMLEREVKILSGGELQRVAIAECLSRSSDIYLLDEPSAYLDVEERLAVARAIRRITKMRGVTAFVVEHDIVTQDFIADKLMVFTGETGRIGYAGQPLSLEKGMNTFLEEMGVTFRRDSDTKRPRVNKPGSKLDREQKENKRFYYSN
ncbi:MAG: ribosome biogenesis/translation initiation ATPase RLI [Candidatus Bathyarchaeota archaeon]|nr:ribosome biogenesis/translation initiation ATPase RLI [Candidatus Bathyarchaeota archaeon]